MIYIIKNSKIPGNDQKVYQYESKIFSIIQRNDKDTIILPEISGV